jgi:hypothetical protein
MPSYLDEFIEGKSTLAYSICPERGLSVAVASH